MVPYLNHAIAFLAASFPYATEFQSFFMALQGVMIVRNGSNKDGKMPWFHAFAQGVVISYAGGLLAPFWMGRPTPMLSSDVNMASCIIAYILVNCVPFGIGHKVSKLLPMRVVTVMGAQLFRAMGTIKFVNIAYEAFKDSPSAYYPTPIFGPILNGTILGNMGGLFWNGFNTHFGNGMPFPVQNGLFVTSLYHFVSHDSGPIGESLRTGIDLLPSALTMGLSNTKFAIVVVSLFMQINGILQMPDFFGPSFNPFIVITLPYTMIKKFMVRGGAKTKNVVTGIEMQKKKKKMGKKQKSS